MTKEEYLFDLLTLCTESQKDMFNRMYPDGVKNNKIDIAISQIKNTILDLNKKCDKLKVVEEELVLVKEGTKQLENEVKTLSKDNGRLENQILRLSNPIVIENSYVQERLAILDALEAGGVDNWSYYSYALEEAGL